MNQILYNRSLHPVKIETPAELHSRLPTTNEDLNFIETSRANVRDVLFKKSKKLLIIVGPCSIHNLQEGFEYAQRLKSLIDRVGDVFCMVMRTYFEKPRTSIGWKGLVFDPCLDNSSNIPLGIEQARRFLLELTRLGVPCATEVLDPLIVNYFGDLITWASIGARTAESQVHRQLASSLPCPVGFKNTTCGSIEIAANSILAAKYPHYMMTINSEGQACFTQSEGNRYAHLVLRGSMLGTNWDSDSVKSAENILLQQGLPASLIIDCAHDNSNKSIESQASVFKNVIEQVLDNIDTTPIKGIMLESNIRSGNQSLDECKQDLAYGVSITDPCLSWDETESLILAAYDAIKMKCLSELEINKN